MKRITSLDFLRGLAIFMMTIFHALMSTWNLFSTDDIFSLPIAILIIAPFIIILVHWRGIFILISAISNFYHMIDLFRNGKSRTQILIRQLVSGIIMLVIAKIFDTFFTTWGVFDNWTRHRGLNWEDLNFFYFVEALDVIAFGIIFNGILFYFLSNGTGLNNWKRNLIICAIIGIFIFAFAPVVHEWVNVWSGFVTNDWTLQSSDHFKDDFGVAFSSGFLERVFRVIFVWLGGREAPIFPMLGLTFFGSAIGIILSKEKKTQKDFRIAYIFSGVMMLVGVVIVVAQIFMGIFVFNPGFHIHPTWFIFFNTGVQIILIVSIIRGVEYNPKLNQERWLKWTLYFRRFGMVALTVYMYNMVEGLARNIIHWIFGADTVNMIDRMQAPLGWTLLMIAILMIIWTAIIFFWEKIKFIGTWEYIIRSIRGAITGAPISLEDPLNLQEKLYHPEMQHFITQQKSTPLEEAIPSVIEE